MAEIASAFVSIVPSMRNFGRDLTSQVDSQVDSAGRRGGSKFGVAFGTALKGGLLAGGVALGAFAKSSVSAASDAQQSIGATETVFGKFADTVIRGSDKAAQAYGLSANEYRENANLLGALFKNQGVALRDLGGATDGMISKASDLAATFGGTTSDAVAALSAAFKGEFDSLEKYGISLKASTISAELAARGQDKLTGAALAAATQQATTDLIFRQSKDSLGAFAAESGTLAGQQQRLGAAFTNLQTTIGTALLPVATQFFGYLNTTALPALSSIGSYLSTNFGPAFEQVRTIVQGFFTGSSGDVSAFAANLKSIVADAVTIVTELWQRFGADIIRYATNALNNVKQVVGGALNVVAGIFKTVSALLKGDWGKAWDGIKQITSGAKDVLAGLVKQLFNVIQTVVSVGWKAIKGLFSTAWDGLKEVVSRGVDKVVEFMKKLPDRIVTAIGDMKDLLLDIGGDIIGGLKRGIEAGVDKVMGAVDAIIEKIPAFIREKLGIKSPSKVMADIAKWIPEGLAKGIADNAEKPVDALQAVVDSLKSKVADLRGMFTSLRDSVASAFAPDLFSSETAAGFLSSARSKLGELQDLKKAFRTLRGYGLSNGFLAQLFASGNVPLILDLAAGDKNAARTADLLNGETARLAGTLGTSVANQAFGDKLDKSNAKLDDVVKELRLVRGSVDRQADQIGRVINGAASNGQRRRRAA